MGDDPPKRRPYFTSGRLVGESFIRDYALHMSIYGTFIGVLSWFLGYYESMTHFFIENRPLSVIFVVTHLVLFSVCRSYRKWADTRLLELEREFDHDQ